MNVPIEFEEGRSDCNFGVVKKELENLRFSETVSCFRRCYCCSPEEEIRANSLSNTA